MEEFNNKSKINYARNMFEGHWRYFVRNKEFKYHIKSIFQYVSE